jgi:hypothetical protein
LGIGYENTALRIGHKNDGIKFDSGSEWLNNIHWRASFSKVWMRTENDYEWIGKLAIRDDIYRAGRQVFYFQLGLDSIYDNRGLRFNPGFEVGDRINFNDSSYLTAFISYKSFHDWYSFGYGDFYRLGPGEDFLSAGLSLEVGLDRMKSDHGSEHKNSKRSWSPKLSIEGGYTSIVDNENYGHSSDLAFDLELFRLDRNKTLKLNTYAGILTLPDDLNPYSVKYGIGPFVEADLKGWTVKALYSYTTLYGLEQSGVIRKYHLLGAEAGIPNSSPWKAGIGGGVYPSTTNFDYQGNLHGILGYRWNLKGISPYIELSGIHLQGSSSVTGHSFETGLQIQGRSGRFSLYYRFQDDFDVFRFGRGSQKLIGFRLVF